MNRAALVVAILAARTRKARRMTTGASPPHLHRHNDLRRRHSLPTRGKSSPTLLRGLRSLEKPNIHPRRINDEGSTRAHAFIALYSALHYAIPRAAAQPCCAPVAVWLAQACGARAQHVRIAAAVSVLGPCLATSHAFYSADNLQKH